jgi:glycosyltransferase involved in cell wall biosynthesis
MKQQLLVSIVMITYGHEKYIRQAIECILMQEGDFDLELVIANDCSPDNTDVIISELLKSHSKADKIRYIKHKKNIGMMPNFIFALEQCNGNYIALCDGDDYWTDPYKLQKQVGFLEANPDYVLSFHKVKILKPDGDLVEDFITKVPENYETQETLARLGNYIHTPSVVFRNIIMEFPPEFSLSPVGDYFLYMMLAEHGKLNYINEEMAVYRYGVGIHSSKTSLNITKTVFNFYSLLLSYSNNPKINQILLERHATNFENFESIIRNEYSESFVSNHVFFKAIKALKTPNKFWKKLKQKFLKK